MSSEADSPSCGQGDDEVLAWVSGPARPAPAGQDGGCPTCGFAGELIAGPNAVTCPACQAEYPKLVPGQGPVLLMARCGGCGLAIGITDHDRDRTLVCPRCKYFLGCVLPRFPRRHGRS